ncbi:hypothetical protein SELMODRAFT_87370 [Selaginella moellendorffii]|uniref:DYW domain-containing protein n=1 Tax=Selaginella moellendorffii TaxID=88036 RepID=D8R8L1_SELML|nr:pentatricopeptide repeat-containing protein At3g12770 [Selaginella moellendorffii]EFJ31717.1 hypothetical protein SELMODRAFT_87370 [Selaginella moellendorffii]|eukprot:XP_002967118.1 pentatricopeptide repeat-containing protein At3g12770 [Selaginella moellendorffii]
MARCCQGLSAAAPAPAADLPSSSSGATRPAHLVRLLRAAGDDRLLSQGRRIHARIVSLGLEEELGNHLLRLYLKCESLGDVEEVFSRLEVRDEASWTTIITAYTEHGQAKRAIWMFHRMQQEGVRCDAVTFLAVLKACARLGDLSQGRSIHAWIVESGLEGKSVLANLLLHIYGSCGCVASAMLLFERMERDLVSWNAAIAANAQSGDLDMALELFQRMQLEGVRPARITLVITLSVCAKIRQARAIHSIVRESGLEQTLVVSTALASAYARLGHLDQAKEVFDRAAERDVVSWNAMLGAYAQHGHMSEAALLFARMLHEGIPPSKVTLVNASTGCSSLRFGRMIHACALEKGLDRDIVLGNALLDMYTRCGSPEEARHLFEGIPGNAVSWNTMIAGSSQKGQMKRALELFQRMQLEGMAPVRATYLNLLEAVASNPEEARAMAEGRKLHSRIVSCGYASEPAIGTAVVKMYASCGAIDEAAASFQRGAMEDRHDVVSWNAIISSLSQHGHGKRALGFFRRMDLHGVAPNQITCVAVLDACAGAAALTEGVIVHDHLRHSGMESNVFVATALASMYGRCGSLESAREIFEKVAVERDVVIFNAMIAAYSQNGLAGEALKLFWRMQQEGSRPDEQSFVSVLSACSHGGLADEGWEIFRSMRQSYGIAPSEDHYACAVDVLGRAGWLADAEELIRCMDVKPTVLVWKTLLGACRKYRDVDRGRLANSMVRELDPGDESAYVVLSNILAGAGKWDEAAEVRTEMESRGLRKQAGKSWIEIKSRVHEFVAGDRSHPRSEEIYRELERLHAEIREIGYVPDTRLVLRKVDEAEKERLLCQHSERLAIALGVMSSSTDTVRVMKNLRVCEDCHNATKFISKIVNKEIVVRDTHRFHHFVDGSCSCGDYW